MYPWSHGPYPTHDTAAGIDLMERFKKLAGITSMTPRQEQVRCNRGPPPFCAH
jgi:hypothetical protein